MRIGRLLVVGVALAALAALVWAAARPGGFLRGEPRQALSGAPVRRGPLRITVTERGNLKAADSVSMKNEVEGTTTILFLVAEGTLVEEGELLCELDVSHLADDRVQQEISVQNAEAAYVKAVKQFEIQKIQNESDVAQAEQALTFARQDLDKYRKADRTLQEQAAEEEITLGEEEYERAKEKYDWSQRLAEKGFLTATELEADALALTRSRIQLEQKRRELATLREYEFPRSEDELVAAVSETERDLERVKLQAAAKLVDFEKEMKTNEAKLELEQEKLRKLVVQIEKGRMFAPKPGMVVYAKEEDRRGSDSVIAEGTQVRERQEIITIPNPGGMIAQASLHESVLKQVRPGLSCTIRVDALREREFRGRVGFVALLPDSNSWWANPNTRLYRTDVQILDATPEMRPGMSCNLEILVEVLEDATYVPVQSIFRHRGENVCFVVGAEGPEMRAVQVGAYNERWTQVVEGVREGETVLLSPPAGFTPEGAPRAGDERPGGESSGEEAGEEGDGPARGGERGGTPDRAGGFQRGERGGGDPAFRRPGGAGPAGGAPSAAAEGQPRGTPARAEGQDEAPARDGAPESAEDGAAEAAGDAQR